MVRRKLPRAPHPRCGSPQSTHKRCRHRTGRRLLVDGCFASVGFWILLHGSRASTVGVLAGGRWRFYFLGSGPINFRFRMGSKSDSRVGREDPCHDRFAQEACRIAALAGDVGAQAKAARAGGRWLLDRRHDPKGAFNLVEPALQDLGMPGLQPDPLRLGIEIVQGLGEAQRQDDRLKLASDLKTNDPRS